jgi:hypothetical protein
MSAPNLLVPNLLDPNKPGIAIAGVPLENHSIILLNESIMSRSKNSGPLFDYLKIDKLNQEDLPFIWEMLLSGALLHEYMHVERSGHKYCEAEQIPYQTEMDFYWNLYLSEKNSYRKQLIKQIASKRETFIINFLGKDTPFVRWSQREEYHSTFIRF